MSTNATNEPTPAVREIDAYIGVIATGAVTDMPAIIQALQQFDAAVFTITNGGSLAGARKYVELVSKLTKERVTELTRASEEQLDILAFAVEGFDRSVQIAVKKPRENITTLVDTPKPTEEITAEKLGKLYGEFVAAFPSECKDRCKDMLTRLQDTIRMAGLSDNDNAAETAFNGLVHEQEAEAA